MITILDMFTRDVYWFYCQVPHYHLTKNIDTEIASPPLPHPMGWENDAERPNYVSVQFQTFF